MDIATPLGLILGMLLILASILVGGALSIFIDIPSVLVVVGGTAATAFIRFGMGDVLNSTKVAIWIISRPISAPREP